MHPLGAGYQFQPGHGAAHGHQPMPPNAQNNRPYSEPNKKRKGNPVITRYAPPPGYVPPQQAQWQQPAYPPQPAWGQPSYFPQQATQHYPPPQAYPPQPGYPPTGHDPYQAYQQTPYQQYPAYPYQAPGPPYGASPPVDPAYAWHQQQQHGQMSPPPPQNLQSKTKRSTSNATSRPDESAQDEEADVDFGFDMFFLGESPFGKDPSDIQPELSLGMIEWRAPVRMKRPLASTFEEAEQQTAATCAPDAQVEGCISQLFQSEQSQLSVKQTDEWPSIKDDPIFAEFTSKPAWTPVKDVVSDRERPGDRDVSRPPEDTDPTPTHHQPGDDIPISVPFSRHPPEDVVLKVQSQTTQESDHESEQGGDDEAMDLSSDSEQEQQPPPKQETTKPKDLLDGLEQALNGHGQSNGDKSNSEPHDFTSGKKRALSHADGGETRRSPPPSKRPRGPSGSGAHDRRSRDSHQESVLAALGVEGSPKVGDRPAEPSHGPPDRNVFQRKSSSHSMNGHRPNGQHRPSFDKPRVYDRLHAPPPPPPAEPQYDPWRAHDSGRPDAHRAGSPRSDTSQCTAPGSDFHPEDGQERKPSKGEDARSDNSRKRRYEETRESRHDGRRRQHDDVTPRLRRNRPSLSAAYSRRW